MAPAEPRPARRRVIFPWAWVGLLVGARVAFGQTDFTIDVKQLATLVTILLGLVGLSVWYAIRGRASLPVRLAIAIAPFVLLLGFFFGFFQFYELKFNGTGRVVGFHRRGTEKADQLLDAVDTSAKNDAITDWGPGSYDYPRFLGNGPWAEASGPPLATDWKQQPPVELWKHEVGAGWSSFAVYGNYAVTQEQRGDDELVVCYELETGAAAWAHADEVRFDPQDMAGNMGRQGPRATPTIVGERIYTQGAKGLVNCLDATTGKVIWQVDTAQAYGAEVPVWGKSGSPLFVAKDERLPTDVVVINVGAPDDATAESYDATLVAFDATTGEEVWSTGWRQTSYASPELVTLENERLILQINDDMLIAVSAVDGSQKFDYPWSGRSNDRPSCSQPIELGENRFLLTKGYAHGSSLVEVNHDGDQWTARPVWDPPIKPVLQTKFSNVVVHEGHAYGMRGTNLECVEISTGESTWPRRDRRRQHRFGFGQVLIAGGHLMVMCEETGEVVLVELNPEGYNELASFQALTDGQTCWNNPVVTGDILLVRNAVEAAAYRLPIAQGEEASDLEESVTAQ